MAIHELPMINLGSAPKSQNVGSKSLDILSSLMLEPVTVITKGPAAAGQLVKARREEISRTKDIGKALDVVGETLTSTLIAGGLVLGASAPATAGQLLKGALPSSLKGYLATSTGLGILATSKQARDFVGKILQDPTKLGREAGLLIDKAFEGKDMGGVSDALRKAGLLGAGVVGGAAAYSGFQALMDKITANKPADTVINTPSQVPSSLALPSDAIPNALSPISSAPVIASPVPEAIPTATVPDINVKVINKPQINVAVAQSI